LEKKKEEGVKKLIGSDQISIW